MSASKPRSRNNDSIPACFADTHGVMTTTTNDMPGYKVTKMLGTIYGITVQSRNMGANFGASLKSIVGGELTAYTKMMYTARAEAMDRMVGACLERGGNAILGVRMDIAAEDVWSQFCAYGTACVIEKIEEEENGRGEEGRKVG